MPTLNLKIVGLKENDPRIRPADIPAILGQVLTGVALHTIREAAPNLGLWMLYTRIGIATDSATARKCW